MTGRAAEEMESEGYVFIWQFLTWLYGICVIFNAAITFIFWTFLDAKPTSSINYIIHICPILSVGVDFILNLVLIELNLSVMYVLIFWVYMLINFIWTNYVQYEPVYPILTWASWQVSLRDFAIYSAAGVILHLIIWLLTWLKLWLLIGDQVSE